MTIPGQAWNTKISVIFLKVNKLKITEREVCSILCLICGRTGSKYELNSGHFVL